MSDLISIQDLENLKKHETFEAEVITGKAGGVAGGADIDSATNGVTGQVQATIPWVIKKADQEFESALAGMGYTRVGTFAEGSTLTNARQVLLDEADGQEYGWTGAFPKLVPPSSTPAGTGGIAMGAWVSRYDPISRIQAREALRRTYAEAGLTLVAGSFEAGGTLTSPGDVLLHEASGKAYGWAGTFPKVVAAFVEGPIGSEWVPQSDSALMNSQYRKIGKFGSAIKIYNKNEAVLNNSDGLYYVYVGNLALPVSVPQTPDTSWLSVGTLNGWQINHIKNWPGSENDYKKLQFMLDCCHAHGMAAILQGSIAIAGSIDVRCPLQSDGAVNLSSQEYPDNTRAPVRIRILGKNKITEEFTLTDIGIDIFPNVGEVVADKGNVSLSPSKMTNCDIAIGSADSVCHDVTISNILAVRNKTRSVPFIESYNCWNLLVDKCSVDEYSHIVKIIPTRGLVNHGILIRDTCGYSANGIECLGMSGLDATITIERCKSYVTRNSGGRAINCAFSKITIIDSYFSSSDGNCGVFQACRVVFSNSKFLSRAISGVSGSRWGLKLIKCQTMALNKCYIRGGDIPGQMSTLIHDLSDIEIDTNTAIHSSKLEMFDNTFESYDRNFRVAGVTDIKGANNTFKCSNPASFALNIHSTLSPMAGYIINSHFIVPSGTTNVLNELPASVSTSTASGRTSQMTSDVTAIVAGTNLPEMDGSRTYIYSFRVSDVSMIEGLVDGVTFKPLTSWISGRKSKLAFNGTAWNVPTSRIPATMANGAVVDSAASDMNWWVRSAVVISSDNVLSSRDFMTLGNGGTTGNETNAPNNKVSALIDADAYHSAQFRAPLVRNGVIYDNLSTGIVGSTFETLKDSRAAIGQKADGTYIVIVVDKGTADSSGTTQKNLALKFIALGCVEAYNLDGGGSATLAVNGVIVNRPADGSERSIPHVLNVI